MLNKILFVVLLTVTVSHGENIVEMFTSANRYYQQKQYDRAIGLYEEIVEQGYEGVSLYYNLGNAYYRSGKLGYSILYYEKALKLSPGDEDIRHNLQLAKSMTVDKLPEFPPFFLFHFWESLLSLFSLTGWLYFAYIIFVLLLISAAGYFLFRNSLLQKYSFFAGIALAALLILSTTVAIVRFNRDVNITSAVIVENTANVKSSPDEGSTETFVVHEGLKVSLQEKIGDWLRVRLEDGKTGWVKEKDLRII